MNRFCRPQAMVALCIVTALAACSREEPPGSAPAAASGDPRIAWIDDERLANAVSEPHNWLAHGRTWSEDRYSPLDTITAENVDRLGLAWYVDLDTNRGQEATPIVVDGRLYSTSAWSKVQAVDAKTGQLLWQYDPEVPGKWDLLACCGVQNRGVAVWKGRVYAGTLDGRLIALDAGTGELVWETVTTDQDEAYTITGAPRVFDDKLVIGNGGAEYGVRGYVSAYSTETGELLWRFYTVPGNPADGFENDTMAMAAETWTGEWWKNGGGGTAWDSFAYDPELNLVYIGTGNGSPWPRALRSPDGGDNLFLASIVAVDADTGEYAWHYQTVPGDTWDYTAVQHMILADLQIGGETRKVLMQAPKNGFFYVLDRATGELLSAENIVPVNWATHIDLDTGRPVETPNARYDETLAAKEIVPGPAGAHNWHPMAFNPDTGLVYIPARQAMLLYNLDEDWVRNDFSTNLGIVRYPPPDEYIPLGPEFGPPFQGFLIAWDPVAQREAWRADQVQFENGGVLTTAGNLVFQGNAEGELVAYNATSGARVWSADVQSGVLAPPISYAIDGEQYIAVVVGWGAVYGNLLGVVLNADGSKRNLSRILAFRIGGSAELPPLAPLDLSFDPPEDFGTAEQLAAGDLHYNTHCALCHGAAAIGGGVIPDLRRSPLIQSAEAFSSVVLDGALLDRGMSSFAPVLSADDTEAIRAYLVNQAHTAAAADESI